MKITREEYLKIVEEANRVEAAFKERLADSKIKKEQLEKLQKELDEISETDIIEPVIEFPDTGKKLFTILNAVAAKGVRFIVDNREGNWFEHDKFFDMSQAISYFIEEHDSLDIIAENGDTSISIEIVDREIDDNGNYEEEGDFWAVFRISSSTGEVIYLKSEGYKSSYNGGYIDKVYQVEPKEKIITVYKKIK